VADGWLLWAAGLLAGIFVVVLALAGLGLVGVFLAAAVWLAARAAVAPAARAEVDEALRRACARLPVCDCHPRSPAR
jgi:hypothetical protein